jgi:prepilin-type N-terminal cleavage/methylation domain-containing protein
MRRGSRGFTLIELACVCAVIGITLVTLAPAVGRRVLQARVAAEAASLQAIAAAIQASFESTDLEATNIAALPGTVPSGVDATAFSLSTDPGFVPSTTNPFDWFAKVARQMGDAPLIGVAPRPALQPRVAAVLINPSGSTRILLEGPSSEAAQQRFLLISLVAAPGQLALPPLPNSSNTQDPANLALFADTWNTDWTSPAAVLPSTWQAALTPAQVSAWQGSGSTPGRLWQLCVQRIVCPRFAITLNDTHPTDNCYVYYNLNGTTAGATAAASAGSGVTALTGILFGRTIQAYRGPAPPPAGVLFSQFILRGNTEITVQD